MESVEYFLPTYPAEREIIDTLRKQVMLDADEQDKTFKAQVEKLKLKQRVNDAFMKHIHGMRGCRSDADLTEGEAEVTPQRRFTIAEKVKPELGSQKTADNLSDGDGSDSLSNSDEEVDNRKRG